jgi:hypothetical protein
LKTRNWVVTGALVAALGLSACASGPPIKSTVGKGTAVCTEFATVATLSATLSSTAPLATLEQQVSTVHAAVVKLQADEPAADTVGNKSVKADLGIEANGLAQLATQLQNANPHSTDPVQSALTAVEASLGGELTAATGRVDDYAKSVCDVVEVTGITTTTAGTGATTATNGAATTTVAPSGPTTSAAS